MGLSCDRLSFWGGDLQASHVPPTKYVALAACFGPENYSVREGAILFTPSNFLFHGVSHLPWFKLTVLDADSGIFSIATPDAYPACMAARKMVLSQFSSRVLRHFAALSSPLLIQGRRGHPAVWMVTFLIL